MDKNVDDILSKSQYGQKRRGYPFVNLSIDKNDRLISLVYLSMDKNVEDILSKSQYGQKHRLISILNLSMDKTVDGILSKSQYGQNRRGYPQ